MKKIAKLLPLLLFAVVGTMVLSACDDKDETISYESLPAQAKAFIQQYYPSAKILTTTKDHDEYEVTLSEGTRIDFNKSGEWTDVDAAVGQTVPSGFYPAVIDTYLSANFANDGINEISKDTRGYDVELVSGTDLIFGSQGEFIGYDR